MSIITINPSPAASIILNALEKKKSTKRELRALARSVGYDHRVARARVEQGLGLLLDADFIRREWPDNQLEPVFVLSPGVKRLRGGKWRIERSA